MITAAQIRGARAMLGLSKAELADRAGIAMSQLDNIEREAVDANQAILSAIQRVLEVAGIVFTNDMERGLKLRAEAGDSLPPSNEPVEADFAALRKAEKAVDKVLARSPTPTEEKAQRKRKLTRVAKDLRRK